MGPFKCPDCGVWWAGVEHRCAWWERTTTTTTTEEPLTTNSFTVRCSCSFDAKGRRVQATASCPIHDVQLVQQTFTTGTFGN